LTDVGERPRLDRRFRHAGGNELRAELLAAPGIIEATWRGQVALDCRDVSRLANRIAFAQRRLVLVLELLHSSECQ